MISENMNNKLNNDSYVKILKTLTEIEKQYIRKNIFKK